MSADLLHDARCLGDWLHADGLAIATIEWLTEPLLS